MESSHVIPDRGLFDSRYLAFLETVGHLRPKLHRYCARMTGSVLDGEDVMQDALFHAYRALDQFDDSRPLAPWLFRIAHNHAIDFLRRQRVRRHVEAATLAELPDAVAPIEPTDVGVGLAIEHLVLSLPPKERACVLLKDVFDYSLEEVAELVDSTVGGVKAALSRGRAKLEAERQRPRVVAAPNDPERARLLHQYLERFNHRDWNGLRELIAADARVTVADRFAGRVVGAPYFGNYAQRTAPWRASLGEVDGEPVIVVLQDRPGGAQAVSVVRLGFGGTRVTEIVDYSHCPWVMANAASVAIIGE